jgi:eukaryotic-like serine/threonine-protein kinase
VIATKSKANLLKEIVAVLSLLGILVSPNLYSPTISDTDNQAILKGMEINPENRPCSVQQWLDLLDIGSQPMIKSQAAMVQTIYPLGIDTSQNLTNIYPTATVRSIYLKPSDENIKVDYELLQKYLESGDLRAANQETKGIMLRLVCREKQGWFDRISINNMSENDLYTINLLWIKYSNGRFGFSMQKCIWEDVGGSVNPSYQVLCEFGDRVGWRINNQWLSPSQINFSPNALNGHLPDLDVEVIGWIATRMMTSDVLL